jgi:hypothetical protein
MPVADRDDDIDSSPESNVIGSQPDSCAVEEWIDEDDEGHTLDDDEFEMVSISTL